MEQKNSFNQGLSAVWLIVIIALSSTLVVGSLVFAWQKVATDKEANKLQQQITDLQNQIQQLQQANNVNDEFADWQTYRNDEYGFEIKQPPDVGYQQINEPLSTYITFVFKTFYTDKENNVVMTLRFEPEDMEGAMREAIDIGSSSITPIIISGVQGNKVMGFDQKGLPVNQIWLKKNGLIYVLDGKGETFNQMLSTFKFIE